MAILVNKTRTETRYNMVRLQFFLHNYFNNLKLTEADLDCATILALENFDDNFLQKVVDKGIFTTTQSVRNCMSKLRKNKIVTKEHDTWKVNPEISIGVDDVILLQLKAKNDPE